jgi:HD-GYP domain-containing protein (c-di-GMP phosphodiesterase class II)
VRRKARIEDALTHERPYRGACSVAEALQEVSAESGRAFDPRVVDAALAPSEERWTTLLVGDA